MRGVNECRFRQRTVGSERSDGIDAYVGMDISDEARQDCKCLRAERIAGRRFGESAGDLGTSALIGRE